jgi:hypothetical protein
VAKSASSRPVTGAEICPPVLNQDTRMASRRGSSVCVPTS